ncbi:MAG TPA: HAMP domain-containing sensor histidine kinase, partial [Candidatus Omnitrophota bacterium]|nr:HAMP domain-containing sensor histidine kinase [Candidatus Omnitrophota bacterium]
DRAEKMQATADMKSRLMSTVSHEFRSPLAAIKEGIALVLEGLIGQINNEQKDILHTAKKNVDRLNRLVENVLLLGKIESGKMEIAREDSDINQLVLETARSIYVLASDKGIDLEIKVDEKIPKVSLDPDRITQVVTNLLSNAIKFTSKGKITVTTKLEGDAVHVTVEDTGPGIEPQDAPKLFDTFETLGGTRLAKGGTGLGLFISKDIITAHKGKIWVESTPGKGSAFHFTLPLKI